MPETNVNSCSTELLKWDTDFFGFKIARLQAPELPADCARQALDWCDKNDVRCLYYLADPRSQESVHTATRFSFRDVDRRITYTAQTAALLDASTADVAVRPATVSDLDSLRTIARVSHHDSRFFQDGHFDRTRCEDLYAQWITNSLAGWADAVFVVTEDSVPAGYVTCSHDARGSIGLIGVAESARGKGFGTALVRRAAEWFDGKGAREVDVVTQGRNADARNFYERLGFSACDEKIWFHKWFDRSDA